MASAYVEIPLGGKHGTGRVTLVDIDDYELVRPHRWWAQVGRNPGGHTTGPYARAKPRKGSSVLMHTLITGLRKVDHTNGNGLDNRRRNLRDGSGGVNERNARKRHDGSSQYKGISWDSSRQAWRARIQLNGKQSFLGHFDDETAAALAYDAAAQDLFGDCAVLNTPG